MFQKGEESVPLVPLLICAGVSVFLMKSGFLSFLFLAPLGYAAVVYNSAWFTCLIAVAVNSVFALAMRFYFHGTGGVWMDIFYFAVLSFSFAWIMQGSKSRVRTVYRFIAASAAGALSFLIFILGNKTESGFTVMLKAQAELLSSLVASAAGADAARHSYLQQMLTPEKVLEAIKRISLRGGAIFSAFFLFFVNRQIAIAAAQVFKKQRQERGLVNFFVPGYTIWAFSFALAAILLTRLLKMEIPEILAWNVLVVCGILFLAQGAGITLFFLAGRAPFFRLIVNVLIILLIFSPGLNTFALAALLLLGVAENWLPLRAPKQGPASTPEL